MASILGFFSEPRMRGDDPVKIAAHQLIRREPRMRGDDPSQNFGPPRKSE